MGHPLTTGIIISQPILLLRILISKILGQFFTICFFGFVSVQIKRETAPINLSVLDGAWISVIRVTLSMNLVLLCSPQTLTLTNPIHSSARRIFLRLQNSSFPLLMHYRQLVDPLYLVLVLSKEFINFAKLYPVKVCNFFVLKRFKNDLEMIVITFSFCIVSDRFKSFLIFFQGQNLTSVY